MQCLVTGGAGFIGSHLVEALVGRGDRVRVLDNFDTGLEANLQAVRDRIELVEGSVTHLPSLQRAMKDVEVVYHLAAIASVQRSLEDPVTTNKVGVGGTLNVLNIARQAGVKRMVYAGSSSCYGDQSGGARSEADALRPLSPYAAAKLAGEFYCSVFVSAYGFDTVRLRFFNVFGPRQDPSSPYSGVIALFIQAMKEGRPPTVHGDGQQTRDFVYVSDAVEGLIRAGNAQGVAGGVYNLGTGRQASILDLVRCLNELLGKTLAPVHGPARAGDVRDSLADISAARRDLGYAPAVEFLEGLKRTIAVG